MNPGGSTTYILMEIVSELLGRSSIKITQEYYGKVVQKRVSKEMGKAESKIKIEMQFSFNSRYVATAT